MCYHIDNIGDAFNIGCGECMGNLKFTGELFIHRAAMSL